MSRILAIILARKGSKGLKNKNIKILNDKPLIYWPISAAKNSKYIDDVIVSTDCEKIAKFSKKFGANVPFLRPKKFALDKSTSFDAIKHCFDFLKKKNVFYKYFLLLEPTSPLTSKTDIDKAFSKFFKNKKAKSMVSVSKAETSNPVFLSKINKSGFISPLYYKKFRFVRRQDLKKVFYFDGSLYLSDTKYYLKKKTFNHNKTLSIQLEKWKSIEIDCINDLVCVEALKKNEKRLQK